MAQGAFQQWKWSHGQRRCKAVGPAELWQCIAAWVEKLVLKVRHTGAHLGKSRVPGGHRNNERVDPAARIEAAQADRVWEHQGELLLARWPQDTSGHLGREAAYKGDCDRGVDLTIDAIAQAVHEGKPCARIKDSKWLQPFWD